MRPIGYHKACSYSAHRQIESTRTRGKIALEGSGGS